jgi:hypothetical protein
MSHLVFWGPVFLVFGALGFLGRKITRRINTLELSSAEFGDPQVLARKTLKRQLMKLQGVDGCESLAERASDHLLQGEERFRTFDRLLRSKLQPSELTFARYHNAAENVLRSLTERLGLVAELLTSVESVRPSEVREKLKEGKVFQERLDVLNVQLGKAETLLQANEEALTEMDRANVALTDMQTRTGLSHLELPEALKQLEELSQRAKRYSV